jgi:prophage regulatory protein
VVDGPAKKNAEFHTVTFIEATTTMNTYHRSYSDMENVTNIRTLRMKDLPSKVGFQPSTIYQLISKGEFPTPFKLTPSGRAAGWLESTIDAWIKSRASQNEGMK